MVLFLLPSLEELEGLSEEGRMNAFRRYFASSRYARLLIQQTLVRSAYMPGLQDTVLSLEKAQSDDFAKALSILQSSKYYAEFIAAAKEEHAALEKIMEAYNKRMSSTQ